ncbi:MAG: CpaD family pilus assembly lipoprotein [Pseudomonadota bacterium]
MNRHSHRKLYTTRAAALAKAALLAGSVILGGCAMEQGDNAGLAYERQPEVRMVRLAHDIQLTPGSDTLSDAEYARLAAFLSRGGVGYGDELQIDVASETDYDANAAILARALARYGLSLDGGAVAYGAAPAPGGLRLVVTRYVLEAPACPDWSQPNYNNWSNARSSNFGCATYANIAQQVANPRDLIEGQEHAGAEPVSTAKAITTYRNRAMNRIFTRRGAGGGGASGGGTGSGASGGDQSGASGLGTP